MQYTRFQLFAEANIRLGEDIRDWWKIRGLGGPIHPCFNCSQRGPYLGGRQWLQG